MYRVNKYRLNSPGIPTWIDLPVSAQLLHVEDQAEGFQVWALVEYPERENEPRGIIVKATGWDINLTSCTYINTFSTGDGAFEWHAFELTGVRRNDPSIENDPLNAGTSTAANVGHAPSGGVHGESQPWDLHSFNGS